MDTERLHLKPLAACLTAMLAWGPTMTSAEPAAAAVPAHPPGQRLLHGMLHDLRAHGTRPGAARARIAATRHFSDRPAAVIPVTSCADDGSDGTLRAVVASAVSGDTVDMSQLSCGTITLTMGQIEVDVDDLTFQGPGQNALTLDGNHADRVIVSYGGAVGAATLAINDLTLANGFKGGAVVAGGCLYTYADNVDDQLVVSRTTITGCTAGDATSNSIALGGGIATFGTLSLNSSTISDNHATGPSGTTLGGGGAYALYGATVVDSTITGNSTVGSIPGSAVAIGGGLIAGGISTAGSSIIRSTISDNTSDIYAGGAFFGISFGQAIDVSVIVSDSTISGNSAPIGSGVYSFVYASSATLTLTVQNSTIAFNVAGSAGVPGTACGVLEAGSGATAMDFESSIAANNVGAGGVDDDICGSGTLSGANNLIMVSELPVPSDTISADPMLGPLQNNGGATFTHALLVGSPAIDAGNNAAALDFDQRGSGYPRVVGVAPDIGAFEVQAPDDTIFANGFDP